MASRKSHRLQRIQLLVASFYLQTPSLSQSHPTSSAASICPPAQWHPHETTKTRSNRRICLSLERSHLFHLEVRSKTTRLGALQMRIAISFPLKWLIDDRTKMHQSSRSVFSASVSVTKKPCRQTTDWSMRASSPVRWRQILTLAKLSSPTRTIRLRRSAMF